jgi:hypothetical protein
MPWVALHTWEGRRAFSRPVKLQFRETLLLLLMLREVKGAGKRSGVDDAAAKGAARGGMALTRGALAVHWASCFCVYMDACIFRIILLIVFGSVTNHNCA